MYFGGLSLNPLAAAIVAGPRGRVCYINPHDDSIRAVGFGHLLDKRLKCVSKDTLYQSHKGYFNVVFIESIGDFFPSIKQILNSGGIVYDIGTKCIIHRQ